MKNIKFKCTSAESKKGNLILTDWFPPKKIALLVGPSSAGNSKIACSIATLISNVVTNNRGGK